MIDRFVKTSVVPIAADICSPAHAAHENWDRSVLHRYGRRVSALRRHLHRKGSRVTPLLAWPCCDDAIPIQSDAPSTSVPVRISTSNPVAIGGLHRPRTLLIEENLCVSGTSG